MSRLSKLSTSLAGSQTCISATNAGMTIANSATICSAGICLGMVYETP
jgi:hypothetical protein